MKIQCDVCDKGEASVFCIADEAALCNSCDHRVHHANKLASKHQRFSLLQPPHKQAPFCDICQERRAFLFCQQDRAILCRECDIPIHKANEHTEKHNRFLLTGVKLSANSALYSSSSSSSSPSQAAISANHSLTNGSDAVPTFNPQKTVISKPVSINPTTISQNNPNPITTINAKATTTSSAIANTIASAAAALAPANEKGTINCQMMNGGDNNSPTSSIAEYLIEMLPGWHVEDFLDSSSSFGFCKSISGGDGIPFWDDRLQNNLSSFLPETTGLCVPQATPVPVHAYPTTQTQWFSTSNMGFGFGGQIGSKDIISNVKSSSRKWNDDNSFAVPQISPPSSASSKRLKTTTLW